MNSATLWFVYHGHRKSSHAKILNMWVNLIEGTSLQIYLSRWPFAVLDFILSDLVQNILASCGFPYTF